MKVEDILSSGLVNTDTEIVIGISGERTYCKKRWFSETLLKYKQKEVEKFTWQDNNMVFISLKRECGKI